jgi:putative tryptophan/tyrosine transport system substrate-binding protein
MPSVLVNPANTSFGPTLQRMESSAKALRLSLRSFALRSPEAFDAGFAAIVQARSDALVLQDDTVFGEANAATLAQLAQRHRLPALGSKGFSEAGGLVGYGSLETEMYRRGAHFVARILKGARPGDLPIEQATRFELVLNVGTARAIGIGFPQALLLRADRLIE